MLERLIVRPMDKVQGKDENAVGSAKDAIKDVVGSGSDTSKSNKA